MRVNDIRNGSRQMRRGNPRKIHKLEVEDYGRYEYYWLACRDPERFNEGPSDGRTYLKSVFWADVTCLRCLRGKP